MEIVDMLAEVLREPGPNFTSSMLSLVDGIDKDNGLNKVFSGIWFI